MSDHFRAYGVGIRPDGAVSTTLIGGVENQSMPLGSQHVAEETAGAIYAGQAHVTEIKPRGSFGSYAVGSLLTLLGLRGAYLNGGASAGFEMHQIQLDEVGMVKSGTVHRKLVIPNGLIVPRSISCSHRQSAMLSAEAISIFDGTNAPVQILESQAAPTGLTDTHRFTLGAITVAGVTFAGNLSVEIDFGNNSDSDGGDSEPYDSNIETTQVLPTITIRGKDVKRFADTNGIPLVGSLGVHADTSIVLRRRVRGTAAFSEAADSIKITAEAMAAIDDPFQSSGNRRGEIALKLTCLDDGTNAPLVFDTAFDNAP